MSNYHIFEKAKLIEQRLPELRKQHLKTIKEKYSEIKRNQFHHVVLDCQKELHNKEIALDDQVLNDEIEALKLEAVSLRAEYDRLVQEEIKNDPRAKLNPEIDEIPDGEYQKLKACSKYPKRKCCNWGENATSKWDRCQFMKYDQSSSTWVCIENWSQTRKQAF